MTPKLSWTAEDVARAVSGKPSGAPGWQATGVSIDSRTVQAGDLFIALKGPMHDGHDHVAAALKAGAVAAIVALNPLSRTAGEGGAHSRASTREWEGEGVVANDPSPASAAKAAEAPSPAMRERENAPLILVADTMKALEDLGHAGRTRSKAKIIAVTGSVGKTGTKEMLRLMLSACGDTYANEGSFNNQWGVPLSLARLPETAQFGVFELGMNHAGELGPLSKQVHPHIALITNVEAVHLEFFPSVEAIAGAKAEIFLGMDSSGTAVLNRDNAHFARLDDAAAMRGIGRIVSFGHDKFAEAKLLECEATAEGSEILAEILGRPVRYKLGAPGEHLAFNSVGALLAAVTAGADVDACMAALAHYQPPKGRGATQSIFIPSGEITLIDESYNASPASVRAAISVLGHMTPKSGGRRIMVLGDMRELGTDSPTLHAALAKNLIEAKIAWVYCCGPMMTHLFEALPPGLRGSYAPDSATLAPLVAKDLRAGDIVTIKGSKAIEMPRVIDAIKALDTTQQKKMARR